MKTTFAKLTLIFATSLFLLASCEPEKEYDSIRDQYIGTWNFSENKMSKSVNFQSYTVKMTENPFDSTKVWLENIGNPDNFAINACGEVTSEGITILSQRMSNGWNVEGEGTLTKKSEMKWTYIITLGGDKEYYTATATKN